MVRKGINSVKDHKMLDFSILEVLNSLPNNKIWTLTKLKEFADEKFIVAKMLIFLFDRVENIEGEGENGGYQHSLLFPQCFHTVSSIGSLKLGIVW